MYQRRVCYHLIKEEPREVSPEDYVEPYELGKEAEGEGEEENEGKALALSILEGVFEQRVYTGAGEYYGSEKEERLCSYPEEVHRIVGAAVDQANGYIEENEGQDVDGNARRDNNARHSRIVEADIAQNLECDDDGRGGHRQPHEEGRSGL